jgi:hypothetical protein
MSSGKASELAKLSVLLPSENKADPKAETLGLECSEVWVELSTVTDCTFIALVPLECKLLQVIPGYGQQLLITWRVSARLTALTEAGVCYVFGRRCLDCSVARLEWRLLVFETRDFHRTGNFRLGMKGASPPRGLSRWRPLV